MPWLALPRDIIEFSRILSDAGHQVFIVGGAVRDAVLGRKVSDYDAATDAPPERVMRLFKRVIPTGVKHGTVTVLWRGFSIETTTFRAEGGYSDGRRPDEVRFGVSIEEDLERRDFTINAMAWDPVQDLFVDPHGGLRDLDAKLVRAVGDPAARFGEDGLRILRALRFATQLGFEVEAATLAAIPASLERLGSVSAERIRDELVKMIGSQRPSVGFRLMEACGILHLILPELALCRGVEQKGFHSFDVLDHLLIALDAAEDNLEVRLAALLHDIGKPQAKAEGEDGVPTFYRHEEYSARMAEALLRRLRFSNETIAEVTHLIAQHMFHYEDTWSDAAVRRFLARAGKEHIAGLLALRMADSSALSGVSADPRALEPLRDRIEELLARDTALGIKDLAIGGNELAVLGVPRGPAMGRILAELLEAVLDDPELNTPERLALIATRLKEKHGLAG